MSGLVRAELRRIHSPDVSDLARWTPVTDDFSVLVQLMVGPVGAPGAESFDVVVCSAAALRGRTQREGTVWWRHVVVVDGWNWREISSIFERRVSSLSGETWTDVAEKLSRWAQWEFEDHHD